MTLDLKVLELAMARHTLVQFVREALERPGYHLIGVPVAIGRQWVILARMDDAIRLDGFDALRLADVSSVKTRFRNRQFYLRGLASKRRIASLRQTYRLESTRALIRSVQEQNPLLTVEREAGQVDGADVGRVVTFGNGSFSMRTISPNADWRKGRVRINYEDVTRIGFASEYEETLSSVAGLASPLWR
jgi:hypothetical protein